MGEDGSDTATVEIDDPPILAAGKDDAAVKGIVALGVD